MGFSAVLDATRRSHFIAAFALHFWCTFCGGSTPDNQVRQATITNIICRPWLSWVGFALPLGRGRKVAGAGPYGAAFRRATTKPRRVDRGQGARRRPPVRTDRPVRCRAPRRRRALSGGRGEPLARDRHDP